MELKNTGLSRIEKAPGIPTLVAAQIMDLISDGSLKPGDKLPSEQNMTKLFGISRISLREAMKLLEAKGYIESRDRRGKFIMQPQQNIQSPIEGLIAVDPEKIWELLSVRRFLDAEAAGCACRRATKRDILALKKICETAVTLGIDDVLHNIKEGGKLYTRFFDLIARLTGNSVFIYLRKSINTILIDVFPYSRKKLSLVDGSSRTIVHDLFAITDAIEKKDITAAQEAIIAHIDYLEKSLKKAIALAQSQKDDSLSGK